MIADPGKDDPPQNVQRNHQPYDGENEAHEIIYGAFDLLPAMAAQR